MASIQKKADPRRASKREASVDEIYERIYVAILEHRLNPGSKLGEDRLATIFGVSRARIREVLARLAYEGIVDLFPQRGAFLAKPSAERARNVFEARRLLEPGVVRRLIDAVTAEKLAKLREHQDREMDARRRDDKRSVIRLSGEFHTLLAELAGNAVLAKTVRELTTITCLVILLYDTPTSAACRADEHGAIIDAIGKREAAKAERLMLQHLDHIEHSLDLAPGDVDVDLEAIFAP